MYDTQTRTYITLHPEENKNLEEVSPKHDLAKLLPVIARGGDLRNLEGEAVFRIRVQVMEKDRIQILMKYCTLKIKNELEIAFSG